VNPPGLLWAQEEFSPSPSAESKADSALPPESSPQFTEEQSVEEPMLSPPNSAVEQPTLLSSEALIGMEIKNAQGEELGSIRELMVDPQHGSVTYAIVVNTGILGIETKSFAIPWEALKVGLNQTEVIVELRDMTLPPAAQVSMDQH
jgi:sporulation protein YlmC with PRC-barrel domain